MHLPIVEEERASPEVAKLYADFLLRSGRAHIPGILKCFATHPPLLKNMMELAETMLFTEGALGRRHKELIATFVSSRNACAYCADSHGYSLSAQGGSEELVSAAMACDVTAKCLTRAEQSLLAFCGKVSEESASISTTDVEALRGDGWSELAISEAVHLTALFATFNRVVNAFGLPSQNLLATIDLAGTKGSATTASEVL